MVFSVLQYISSSHEHGRLRAAELAPPAAVVLDSLARLELVAHRGRVADVRLPARTVMAELVRQSPAGVPGLHRVAPVGHRPGRGRRLEGIVTSAAAAVPRAGELVGLVQLLELAVPVPASLPGLLREHAVQSEEADAGQGLAEL